MTTPAKTRTRAGTLTLGCGTPVFHKADTAVLPSQPRLAMAADPDLEALLAEALTGVKLGDIASGATYERAVNLGRPVGFNYMVETGPGVPVYFLTLKGMPRSTRFTDAVRPTPCETVVVRVFRPQGEDVAVLISGYVGDIYPPEPWRHYVADTEHPGVVEWHRNHARVPQSGDEFEPGEALTDDTLFWVKMPPPKK